ncbi:hypothetical protein MSIMFI_03375 [Mycobacterium simulans]|nr:hypothetical protein MSIMFI_03375 [Mycobacterium simulans]
MACGLCPLRCYEHSVHSELSARKKAKVELVAISEKRSSWDKDSPPFAAQVWTARFFGYESAMLRRLSARLVPFCDGQT